MSQALTRTASATNFDLPSLHILLEEIDTAIKDAETHLSEFHDDEEQVELLMDSAVVIEQLACIFDLINLEGTDELARAIANNLKKLHDSGDNTNTELVMDISEGIMLLDRYVEFVLLKEVLEPALLIPIINKLKAHLDEPAIDIKTLTKGKTISISNPNKHYEKLSNLNLDMSALVLAYRAGLGVVLTNDSGKLSQSEHTKLDGMSKACRQIASQSKALFWQAAAVSVHNLADELPLSNDKKRTLIYLEQQLQYHLPLEDRRFADLVSLACQRNSSFNDAVQQKYGFHQLSKQEQDVLHRFLFGPNREITDTLNLIIQGEITDIKEKVDSLAHGDNHINMPTSEDVSKQIHHLGQAMQLLGLDEAHTALTTASDEVARWQTPTPNDFDALLTHLMVAENAAIFLAKSHTPGAVKLPLHNRNISLHQLDTAYDVLIKESRDNIATINGAIESYINDPNRDILHIQNIPEMLGQVVGAANFLNLPKTAEMLTHLTSYMDEMTTVNRQKLSDKLLASIADVVVAADYQLEGHEQNRPVSKTALLVGRNSLNRILAA